MGTRSSRCVGLALVFCFTGAAIGPGIEAQAPPVLDVQLCAGLTVTGTVGAVYSIDYVTDLARTNDASAWRCIEYVQLPATPYLWIDRSAPATERRFYRAVEMAAPAGMVFVPPGTFHMGSPTNEVGRLTWEGPQTAVTISRGYWLGQHEVTQWEYQSLIGTNPSAQWHAQRPVEQVSWHDATNYCAIRTEQERAAGRIATNSVYRLPTEVEWEYACRAGTSTRFSYGEDPDYAKLTQYAWYYANSYQYEHPVEQKLPNRWGLYDMHGNVWEWCQDWWSDRLPGNVALDPRGPPTGLFRVIRGGFYFSEPPQCRSAYRLMSPLPTTKSPELGFRVVLAPGQP